MSKENRGRCACGVGRGGLKGRQWPDGVGTCGGGKAFGFYSVPFPVVSES